MNELPKRKPIRIEDYDYSTPGSYFITVCVNDRNPILRNVEAAICRPFSLRIISCGRQIAAPYIMVDIQ